MNLGVKIIKGCHSEEKHFRQIESDLDDLDAMSWEVGCASEDFAREIESTISNCCHGGTSLFSSDVFGRVDTLVPYVFALLKYVEERKKPVVLAERFEASHYKRIMKLKTDFNQLAGDPSFHFDEIVKRLRNGVQTVMDLYRLRDENIAANVRRKVPARIRELYPELGESVRYGILIGAAHDLEQLLPQAHVSVHENPSETSGLSLLTRLKQRKIDGNEINYIAQHYLLHVVCNVLLDRPAFANGFSEPVISDLHVLQTTYEDMQNFSLRLCRLDSHAVNARKRLTADFLMNHNISILEGNGIVQYAN